MFRPNRPSSGVRVVVIKESAAHYKAALLPLSDCLGLILGYVGWKFILHEKFWSMIFPANKINNFILFY
jgi:hypothetical protein